MPCICCVYTLHMLTRILWYTNYNIVICHAYVVFIQYIYWQFVWSGTWLSPRSRYYAPEAATFQRVWTGCQSGEAASACSTCTVAAIPCCSFFPRNWLSGLQITMLWSWMCLQDLTRQDPGVRPHSIEFCRHASCLIRAESTFTSSSQ